MMQETIFMEAFRTNFDSFGNIFQNVTRRNPNGMETLATI